MEYTGDRNRKYGADQDTPSDPPSCMGCFMFIGVIAFIILVIYYVAQYADMHHR